MDPKVICLSGVLLLIISVIISLLSRTGKNIAQTICLCLGEVLAFIGLFMILYS